MTDTLPREEQAALKQSTQLEYQARINQIVLYIQQHLNEPLRLEDLAQVACFSPFHIHRIFTAFMGESVGEYIRRLRLAKACNELVRTRRPVTEIGLEGGYETPAAFARAFRQVYRSSPSQVRKDGGIRPASFATHPDSGQSGVPFYPRINSMKHEIRTLPDQKVIYVTSRGFVDNTFNQAAKRSFSLLNEWVAQRGLWPKLGACLGIYPDDPGANPAAARYLGGYLVKAGETIQTDGVVEQAVLPGGRWAVFTYTGPYEGLTQAWNSIYRDWLPASGERLRGTDPFEMHLSDAHTPPAERVTEIHIALE